MIRRRQPIPLEQRTRRKRRAEFNTTWTIILTGTAAIWAILIAWWMS